MNFDFSAIWNSAENIVQGMIKRIPYVLIAIVIFIIFYIVGKSVRTLVRKLSLRSRNYSNVGIILGRLSQWLINFLGLLIVLAIALPNFTPNKIVELLGIGSIAIGFAFRDILQNFLAGILILFQQPFKVGDQIIAGDFEGTVEDIQTRATLIRTYDGRKVVIPNAELFTQSVIVNTAYQARRIEYDVGIGYGDDIDKAKQVISQLLASLDEVKKDPAPEVLVVNFGESAIMLRVRWWITPPRISDYFAAQDQVLQAIREKFIEHAIDLPFPTQQILFHDQTETSDGFRDQQREGWPAGSQPPESRSIARTLLMMKSSSSS